MARNRLELLSDSRRLFPGVQRARMLLFLLLSSVLLGAFFAPSLSYGQNTNRSPKSAPLGGRVQVQNDLPETEPAPPAANPAGFLADFNPESMVSPSGLTSSLNLMLMMTVLTLAPSIFIMTTCFIRFIVVLGLLRQALGTQQLPPNQVIVSLSLFLTFTIMSPVWRQSYDEGIRPYTNNEAIELEAGNDRLTQTLTNTMRPLRRFMIQQIDSTGNGDSLAMFIDYQRNRPDFVEPETYDDASIWALLPAFMMSELKTAFTIGFIIYLPFVIIDMVIASVLISMGMMMLPPVLISLPFKLLLFILIDGWTLTVGTLLDSVSVSESTVAMLQAMPPPV